MYLTKEETRRLVNRIIYHTIEMIEDDQKYNRDNFERRKKQATLDSFQWENEAEQAKRDIQERRKKTLEEWA